MEKPRHIDPRDALAPGNIFAFVHKEGLEMSKIFQAMKMGQPYFTEFAKEHLLGRVFYCDGDLSYFLCLYGRNQRCDGQPVQRLDLKALAEQVRSNKDFVPQFLRDMDDDDDDEDSQGRKKKVKASAGPHWVRWVVTQPFYLDYMKKRMGEGRRLVGLTLSPIYNPGPDECFLVMSAPPIYEPVIRRLATQMDYEMYVRRVNSLDIPGCKIEAVRWYLSFMFWVRFDGDIPSFITFLVICTSLLHPCGWAPCKISIFSGDQGCGKSETLTWLASLLNPINTNDNITIEQLTSQFNMQTCKPRLFCHEAGPKWEQKLNNGIIRSLVTDIKAMKTYQQKFAVPLLPYGSPMMILAADRMGEGSILEQGERRNIHVAFAKDPKEPSEFRSFHRAVQLFSRLFSQVNGSLNQFREDFRKQFLEYIAIYFDLICPTGIKVPNLFQRRDFFDGRKEDGETGAASQTISTSTKRAKTSASVAATYADAVNSMAYHLADTGSIFPVMHPDVFLILFTKSLGVFSETDTAENRSNFIRRCLQATWNKDITVYVFEGVKYEDTLVALHEQWKTEDTSDMFDQSPEAKAYRNQVAYNRMLCKFKSCLMIDAWLAFDKDPNLPAWPRLLSNSTALWLLGVWINFKAHNNRLNPTASPWGGNDVIVDVEKLGVVARLLANRLSGRAGFQGPREFTITASLISKVLGLNLSSFLGIGQSTLVLKAINLTWGPFSIIKNLIVQVSANYRPSEEKLDLLARRCGGEMGITDQDRIAYDSLLSATKSRLMGQLAEFFMNENAISDAHEEERIFYALYMDLFSGGPVGLMKKDEFYATLDDIDKNVKAVHATIGYRPPAFNVFKSPISLGETPMPRREVTGTTMCITPTVDYEAKAKQLETELEMYPSTQKNVSPIITLDEQITQFLGGDEVLSYGALESASPDGLS